MLVKRMIMGIGAALLVPAVLAAQTPQTQNPANEEHASETALAKSIPALQSADIAKQKVAEAMARRATRVRGHAVGIDNRPVTPASPSAGAHRAVPNPGAGPATRGVRPDPVTPASPSQKPSDPGSQGISRRP